MTERIQLRRSKGWRMPAQTVKVDRSTRWGNPFVIDVERGYTAGEAVKDFEALTRGSAQKVQDIRQHLKGKNLACWCAIGRPCHADVLLRIANEPGGCLS